MVLLTAEHQETIITRAQRPVTSARPSERGKFVHVKKSCHVHKTQDTHETLMESLQLPLLSHWEAKVVVFCHWRSRIGVVDITRVGEQHAGKDHNYDTLTTRALPSTEGTPSSDKHCLARMMQHVRGNPTTSAHSTHDASVVKCGGLCGFVSSQPVSTGLNHKNLIR